MEQLRNENAQAQRTSLNRKKKLQLQILLYKISKGRLKQQEEESTVRAQSNRTIGIEDEITERTTGSKRTDLRQLQDHQERTKEQILQTQEKVGRLRQELAEESRKYDAKKNEHDLLKSLIDSMEGYPESVKFLHKNPNWNHTAPVLSDIIYVKEEFRTAVENVLEPYLNYYVVNNLEEGLQAVHLAG